MPFALRIALRYIFSKNVVNLLSGVSILALTVGTAAFLIILSVFNGFEGMVVNLYNAFYADMRVVPAKGKTFEWNEGLETKLSETEGVMAWSTVLEENALLQSGDRQHIATLKGVDEHFVTVSDVDDAMLFGEEFRVQYDGQPLAILGAGVDMALQTSHRDAFSKLSVYLPKRGRSINYLPTDGFKRGELMAWGAFGIQDEFDQQFVFVPIGYLQSLLNLDAQVSAVELSVDAKLSAAVIQQELSESLGPDYLVQSKFEQNAFLYRIMRMEKWLTSLILSFVLIIVAFNIIGALSMVVISKRRDISILKAIGATHLTIRNIYLWHGALQGFISVLVGFAIAVIILLLQQHFGLVKLAGGSFLIDAYPVEMRLLDFVFIAVVVISISLGAAWFPAVRAGRQAQLEGLK